MMKPSKSGGKVKQNQLFSLQTHGYSWQDGGMANDTKSKKKPAAVALGRLGGLKGGGNALAAKMKDADGL